MSKFNIINEVSLFFPKFNSWINKIPGKPVKSIESKKEVGKYFLDFLKNEGSWSKSGNKTSFNQIQKMMDLGVVKNICRSHNGYSYLELSDNVNNQQKVTHELYYKIIDGDVYLTQAGLHLYLRVEFNFLLGIDEYVKISKFYENITQGLVDILREFRNKEMNLTKHYFTGL